MKHLGITAFLVGGSFLFGLRVVALNDGGAAPPAKVAAHPSGPNSPLAASGGSTQGGVWSDPATHMQFVYVPGGEFDMGCGGPWAGDCYLFEGPAHKVRLGPFWLGTTEVTQGQWVQIMKSNPSTFQLGDDYPVEHVSWEDAQEFIRRLNARSTEIAFRLPTEAEWEYACRRGGQNVAYGTASGGISDSAANVGGTKNGTVAVGTYPPNDLGLYDMAGNASEWVQDTYTPYESADLLNPISRWGTNHVARGGGWASSKWLARCTYRSPNPAGFRSSNVGFRIVRVP